MARYYGRKNYGKKTYGKPFRKKSSRGKHRKGTMVRYVYRNGRRVGTVPHRRY